ncbi:UNVERIFIED_CONTAM: hypothetical protein FKN15_034552 [Acipenser sinensis]
MRTRASLATHGLGHRRLVDRCSGGGRTIGAKRSTWAFLKNIAKCTLPPEGGVAIVTDDNPPSRAQFTTPGRCTAWRDSRFLFAQAQLATTTPALTREGEDEHTLSSEACAVSQPLFSHCRLTVQPPQSYSIGGQRSFGQLTGKPAGARPDDRGRWCVEPRTPWPT